MDVAKDSLQNGIAFCLEYRCTWRQHAALSRAETPARRASSTALLPKSAMKRQRRPKCASSSRNRQRNRFPSNWSPVRPPNPQPARLSKRDDTKPSARIRVSEQEQATASASSSLPVQRRQPSLAEIVMPRKCKPASDDGPGLEELYARSPPG